MQAKIEEAKDGRARITLDVAVDGQGRLSSTGKTYVLDNGRLAIGNAVIQVTVYRK